MIPKHDVRKRIQLEIIASEPILAPLIDWVADCSFDVAETDLTQLVEHEKAHLRFLCEQPEHLGLPKGKTAEEYYELLKKGKS